MAFCTQCGIALGLGNKFCGSCGRPVPLAGESDTPAASPSGSMDRYRRRAGPRLHSVAKSAWALAFEGFLVAIFIDFPSQVLGWPLELRVAAAVISGCCGIAYFLIQFRRWRNENWMVLERLSYRHPAAWEFSHSQPAGASPARAAFSRPAYRRPAPQLIAAAMIYVTMALLTRPSGAGGNSAGLGALVNRVTQVRTAAAATESPREIVLRDVTVHAKWRRGELGSILLADFTLDNPSQYQFKDFQIRCIYYAPSGTALRANTATIYQVMDPASTKTFKEVNMGFREDQGDTAGCTLKDFTVMH